MKFETLEDYDIELTSMKQTLTEMEDYIQEHPERLGYAGNYQTLQDRNSQKSTERTYALFAENPDGNFTLEDFKRVARETGDNSTEEDLKKIFNFASSNGKDIPYEEFHAIMTKSFGN